MQERRSSFIEWTTIATLESQVAADGGYTISNLQPGQYTVTAAKGELQSSPATVYVAAQQDLKVDLSLAVADEISPAVARKFEAMMARIDQLEAELKARSATEQAAATPPAPLPPRHGDLLATTTNDPSQIPIIPATLAKPDTASKEAALLARCDRCTRNSPSPSRVTLATYGSRIS